MIRAALLGAALLLAGFTSAQAQPAPNDTAKLYELAKKEGSVVWYESGPLEAMQNVARDFETQYPGIKVEVQRIVGVAQYQRFLMETQAHQNLADVLAISDQPSMADLLAQGMLDLQLLDRTKVGSLEDVIEKRAYFPFYMHRTGHWLGMDVHDCGAYTEPSEIGNKTERKDALTGEMLTSRPARILQSGMVLTIEPGIYVRPADGVPEAFHNIGIRIEDDAIVTDSGCELISRGVPVEPDAIEALMRG